MVNPSGDLLSLRYCETSRRRNPTNHWIYIGGSFGSLDQEEDSGGGEVSQDGSATGKRTDGDQNGDPEEH